MHSYFINEAIDKAIKNYLDSKNNPDGSLYNSFLVVIIRMLIIIYGELDIINPYKTKNEVSFNNNLMKFGAKEEDISYFKTLLENYYEFDKHNNKNIKSGNIYFVSIQKQVIDLYNYKRKNYGINDTESKEFFDLLYTPGTSNYLRMSFNYLNADNIYEVGEYFQKLVNEEDYKYENKKKLLNFDVYKYFNISISDLSKMNESEIDILNEKIYNKLGISQSAMNKEYLLSEKIKELTKNDKLTGNGYVDILLITGIIVSVIATVIIIISFIK